jgi:hypothetical protein
MNKSTLIRQKKQPHANALSSFQYAPSRSFYWGGPKIVCIIIKKDKIIKKTRIARNWGDPKITM